MPRYVPALALAAAFLVGCGEEARVTTDSSAPTARTAAQPQPVEKVRAPVGDVVLRMSKVSAANRGKGIAAFDLETIESLGTTETTIHEPFLKRDVRFTGVPLKDLLRAAGVPTSATKVKMHALDDYVITPSVAEMVESDALLATRADGKAIPIAKGGPVRIVYSAETSLSRNTDMWIWSVDSMRFAR